MMGFTNLFKKYYFLLTSLFIFLTFPSYDIWILKGFPFFAWISLIPLFLYVRSRSYREVFIYSFVAGLFGNFLAFRWIGAFGAKVEGGYIIVLIFLIPSLTVFFTTKIIIAEYLSRNLERLRFLIFPSTWIFVDWIQSIGFLAFPWTYWGYSQYPFTSLIQMSSFTGVMGVTFIIVMVNCAFADLMYSARIPQASLGALLKTPPLKRLVVILSLILLITVYGYAITARDSRAAERDLRVSIVQTCISPWENWFGNRFIYLDSLKYYTRESLKHDPDFIVWSEYATLEKISYDYQKGKLNLFERLVLGFAQQHKKALLTGEIGIIEDVVNERLYPQNSAVLINEEGEVVKTYPKINLVPFGEWFPYGKWIPYIQNILYDFGGSNFVPGDEPVIFEIKGKKFGCLICYEGIFFRLCREYRKLGADFFVNITNDGWTDTYSGHMQHFAASVFRAIENGIWYIRGGNTGYSALINPHGSIVQSMPILKKGYIVGDIDFSMNRVTFYSRFGDVFLYLTMAFLFVISVLRVYTIGKRDL